MDTLEKPVYEYCKEHGVHFNLALVPMCPICTHGRTAMSESTKSYTKRVQGSDRARALRQAVDEAQKRRVQAYVGRMEKITALAVTDYDLLGYIRGIPRECFSKSRLNEVVQARRKAMKVLKDHFKLGYAEIARIFGVDHTSVIYHCKREVNVPWGSRQ